MKTRPQPHPSPRAGRPADDFEWPPKADEPGVYVVALDAETEAEPPPGAWRRRAALAADPDPWRVLQEAATEAFAQRHGVSALRPAVSIVAPRRVPVRRLAALLASTAAVVTAASWTLYHLTGASGPAVTARIDVPVEASEPAADAPDVRPPLVTIVATYPADDRRAANDRLGAEAVHTNVPPAAIAASPVAETQVAAIVPQPALLLDPSTPPPDAPAAAAEAGPSVSPMPAATVTPVAIAAEAVTGPARDARIRKVLDQYEAAYDRRDVRTAAALVPSHDVRALSRAFDGLDRQDVSFDRCDIDAGDERGSAVCVGTVRYVPRVGRSVEREGRITWTFHLTRLGDDWRIDRFSAR
jgi:hypothetical protein